MKKLFGFTAILLCAFMLLPLTALKPSGKTQESVSVLSEKSQNTESFRLCFSESEKVEEIASEDYIFGVVAAEMPALYENEALKAQAVAAYTFALYKKQANKDKDFDITDSHLTDQSFITKDEAKERWGTNADQYIKKIETAISQVKGYTITYNSAPILAVYHAISFGKTESAKDIWGGDYPYLKSTDSYGDKLSKDYISTLTLTSTEFKEKLKTKADLSDNPSDYIGPFTRTGAGTVKTVKICNTEISGNELREIFNLKSANFEINYSDDNFTFTVYGYGHGVGLSQNGANHMAKQGADFKQILKHYYNDCKIEK